MKILLVNVHAKNSSTGDIAYALHTRLLAEGHESLLCFGRGKNERENGLFKFGFDVETYIHALATRLFGFTDNWSFFSTLRLIQKIKAFKPELIHLHAMHAYFIHRKLFWRFIQKSQIPVVWSVHSDLPFTGRCGIAYACDGFKYGCPTCTHLNYYPKTLFFDHAHAMYKVKKQLYGQLNSLILTMPSAWLSERVGQSFLSHYSRFVVPNGFTPKPFQNENVFENSHLKNVLCVMPRFEDENKGANFVLELAKMLPNMDFTIVSKTCNLGRIAPNVFARTLSPNALANAYAKADAFLLCSKFETFSMTCLEALSYGTPVVGFACGAPETLFQEPFAHFVPYGNVPMLKDTLQKVLSTAKHREQIQNYAKQHFSLNTMIEQYFDVYQKALAKTKHGDAY